jgi:AcrR family transcriptional regulator
MSSPVKRDARPYDNSSRAAHAAVNRASVIEAAARLLVDHGYSATTMARVARAAGVSVETVYKAFKNKPELVRQVLGAAVAGDDEAVALIERPGMQAALHAATGDKILTAFATFSTDLMIRIGPLLASVLVAGRAGEAEIREISEVAGRQRLADYTRIIEAVAAAGDLDPRLEVSRAADAMWSIGSPEVYFQLTADRGWTETEYRTWLTRTLQATLLR